MKVKISAKVSKKKKYVVILVFVLLIPTLCIVYGYFEARNIIVKEMVFTNKDLPLSFDGCKIIFVSDFHFNYCFSEDNLIKIIDEINRRNPDIIILGGDYTYKSERYSDVFFREVGRLKSKYGVYTVLGNHDHWSDAKLIQKGLTGCGFNICDNRSYWIKNETDSIKVGGVGDFWEDVQLPENTLADVSDSDFCILISHNPDYMEKLKDEYIDLMLSGHTHAGQITLFGLWAPIMPSTFHSGHLQTGDKYRYGWKEKGNIRLYVTSGVGVGEFPLRFFANPEIVEIILQKQ